MDDMVQLNWFYTKYYFFLLSTVIGQCTRFSLNNFYYQISLRCVRGSSGKVCFAPAARNNSDIPDMTTLRFAAFWESGLSGSVSLGEAFRDTIYTRLAQTRRLNHPSVRPTCVFCRIMLINTFSMTSLSRMMPHRSPI